MIHQSSEEKSTKKQTLRSTVSQAETLVELEHYLHIEPFLSEINRKSYRGTWEIDPALNEFGPQRNQDDLIPSTFQFNTGIITIDFFYSSASSTNNWIINYKLLNGDYKDTWYSIRKDFTIYRYTQQNDIIFNFTSDNSAASVLSKKCTFRVKPFSNIKITKHNLLISQNTEITQVQQLDFEIPSWVKNDLKGNLVLPGHNIFINFKAALIPKTVKTNNKELTNLSLALTALGMICLYTTWKIFRDCLIFKINPKSISPTLICGNMIWNADMSFICIYLGTINSMKFNDFIIVSLIYILIFTIFENRLLYVVLRNQDEFAHLNDSGTIEGNNNEYKKFAKRVCRWYLFLYFSIFLSVFWIYYSILYEWLMWITVLLTFVPQICHNRTVGIVNNKISFIYILVLSLNKLFIPLYLKAYTNNVLNDKINITYSTLFVWGITVEIIVMQLQGKFGANFMIPKIMRKGYYNYFRSIEEIEKLEPKINLEVETCSICWSILKEGPQSSGCITVNISSTNINNSTNQLPVYEGENSTIHNKNLSVKGKFQNLAKTGLISKFCYKWQNKNKYLMLTPCSHIYHPNCWKEWCMWKNECPICRNHLPWIE